MLTASFQAVMSKLENLVRGLSNKIDGFQKDFRNIWGSERNMGSVIPDVTTGTSHPWSYDFGAVQTLEMNRTHKERTYVNGLGVDQRRHPLDRHVAAMTGVRRAILHTRNNSPQNTQRHWDDVPDTPQYDEVINWGDNLAAGSHSIPPTNVATVSEETETLIKDACTIRLEHANRFKIKTLIPFLKWQHPGRPSWTII